MANNNRIQERTLAQLVNSTNSINVIGNAAGNRRSAYQPLVVRVTDHDDNVDAEQDDPDKMAIFKSIRHGEPWVKDYGTKHVIHRQPAGDTSTVAPTDATVIFPNFDYTTFE